MFAFDANVLCKRGTLNLS